MLRLSRECAVYFYADENANANSGPVSLRCPHCNRFGTFAPLTNGHDVPGRLPGDVAGFGGLRRCPHPGCFGLVTILLDNQRQIVAAYPPELIDFDISGVPQAVEETVKEAILCHGNGCYRAAAIMVRRTLEVICQDQNATGKTLKNRLDSLRQHLVVPKELFDAADHLRLLGNDAAHIDAQTYAAVGREEVEIALDLAKELVKATYQYASLVSRLKGLQQPSS